jgi:hypothetical protein
MPSIVLKLLLAAAVTLRLLRLIGIADNGLLFFRPRPFSSEERTAETADDRFANGLPGVAQPGKIDLVAGASNAFSATARIFSPSRQPLGATAGEFARIAAPGWLKKNRAKKSPRQPRGHKSSHGAAASPGRMA